MKKTFKSILSVMLVISMIMGMSGICAVSAAEDTQTQAEDRGAPNADVSILKPLTLTAAEHDYMAWPSGDSTVDRPLQMVMNFKANETMEEAAAGAFADFKCDFYLTFTGLANGSIVADDCYLAGNYGSFGWIVIPADGLELEDGVEYPVMAAYDANLKYAQDICGSVKDFTAAIYVAPEILEANPDFAVSLALKMTNPEDETDVITVGEPAVFNATALNLSADVPAVEDDGLANEANLDAIEDARAELLALGVTEAEAADATATIDITIASTPDENGVIVYNVAPTLTAGGKSVKMSSFAEALTFRLPVLATETKTAANVYHDGALMGTYDIIEEDGQKFVEVSSDTFSEYTVEPVEADRGEPNATVSILKPLTLTAAEHGYMAWPSGDTTVDRPLQMVMNFKANETMEEAAAGAFADFKCDFYLTFTGLANGSIVADDCYLAGNYGSFGWIVIPADGLELEDGVEYPVMAAYDANLKYAQDICGSVKDFTAAIYVAPEILEANPDFAVSLALKMTNPEDETDVITVGEPAVFNATALNLSADVPAVEDDGLANEANLDAIEDARAELLALGVTEAEAADATATIDITIASTPDENGVIVYNVAPTLTAGGKSVKMSSFAEALTFRLPVLATETKTAANVYHDGALMGTYDIIEEDGQKFVEVSSDTFSEYTVEPVETETAVAQIGTETFTTVLDAIAYAVENGSTEIKLLADSREVMPTDVEIVLKNDLTITADAPVTAAFYNDGTTYDFVIDCEGYGDYTFTVAENVTFTLEDRVIWVGYYGSNIDVVVDGTLNGYQVWVGGDVYVNATGTLKSSGEALVIRRGKTIFVDGGKIDANYFNILSGNIFAENGAEIECGPLWINNTGSYANEGGASVTLWDSTLTSSGNITAATSIESGVYIDVYNSTATFTNFNGYGASSFDANTTVYVNGETGTLDVKDLVNNGTVEVYDGGTLNVPANASVTNNGAIVLEAGSTIAGPENMGVTVDADDVEVEYVDGKYVVVETETTKVAEVNGVQYETLAEAIGAADDGDTITVIADIYDEDVTVTKSVTITGTATLEDVSISGASGISLTVANLTFIGDSWINSNGAASLTVSGVTAEYITPICTTATNSRSAFIALGSSEQATLALTVENCNISTYIDATDAILGWAAITEANITGNTFGAEDAYFDSGDAVKFMSIADGAVINIVGNTVYSDYNGIVFAQNTTRDNAYTVYLDDNTFVGSADHVWLEVSGATTCHAAVNATSTNTVNGETFTADDIKATSRITTWTAYTGVDVVLDEDGKVIGGTFANIAEDAIADGYELDENGAVVTSPVAKITDANGNVTSYDSFAAAYAAAVNGDTITLYADVYLTDKFYIAKEITIDGNGNSIIADATAVWYTVSGKLNIKNYKTHLIGVNANNITLKDITLDCNNNAAGINIYCAQNVVFDNVAIINATKGFAALTVNGSTLTVKNEFTTVGNSVAMDISNGDGVTSDLGVTVEEGTVLDLADKTVKFASVAELDMTAAVNAEGEPYFAAQDVAYLYTENQMNSRTTAYGNGLTLLSDVEVNRNITLSGGTLDLNGNNLTVAEGYAVAVSGNVTIAGEGEFNADVTLTKASATLTAPENINVSSSAGDVVYKDGAYVVFEAIEFDGTTMTLGASLSLDFAVDTAKLDGTDNYAVLTHAYADGRTETVTVPQSEWTVYSGTVYTIHFNGLAAKQMNDTVTVTVYNAADEAVSVTLTDSIIAYATRMLDSDEVKADAELMTLYVDMLNYGAAAQEQFGYDTENLANRNLTDEQKAYATAAVETTDNRVKGTGYVGSTLTLESVIELDLVFADNKIGSDYSTLYAIVTYTDHYGHAKELRIEGTDFIEYGSIMCQVSVTGMAIADFRSVVECTVYNADGEALASASDSIESYANRNAASLGAIVDTIVKFGASSYNYFH